MSFYGIPKTKKSFLASVISTDLKKKKKKIGLERYTPPKVNIEPENDGLEDDVPFKFD